MIIKLKYYKNRDETLRLVRLLKMMLLKYVQSSLDVTPFPASKIDVLNARERPQPVLDVWKCPAGIHESTSHCGTSLAQNTCILKDIYGFQAELMESTF